MSSSSQSTLNFGQKERPSAQALPSQRVETRRADPLSTRLLEPSGHSRLILPPPPPLNRQRRSRPQRRSARRRRRPRRGPPRWTRRSLGIGSRVRGPTNAHPDGNGRQVLPPLLWRARTHHLSIGVRRHHRSRRRPAQQRAGGRDLRRVQDQEEEPHGDFSPLQDGRHLVAQEASRRGVHFCLRASGLSGEGGRELCGGGWDWSLCILFESSLPDGEDGKEKGDELDHPLDA